MTTRLRALGRGEAPVGLDSSMEAALETAAGPVEIAPDDPLLTYLEQAEGPVDLNKITIDSPAVLELHEMGVELIVPLIAQGELIGMLNLGRRLSDRDYSTDDRKLLDNLAAQAAPAVRVAQLVREQEIEAQERERIEQELRVATLIQQTLLPKELPKPSGWTIDAYYRPARAVGGDFYDFIALEDGRLALVIGDVTDKGVPAALVMATCRSLLRSASQRADSPGEVLGQVNDVLVDEIPPNMFVTCLYALLDPATGTLVFANAGHNLPYLRTEEGVLELRATGMPLGLMPGMNYEQAECTVEEGQTMLLSSDGLVEAHSPEGEMFGFPRVMGIVGKHARKEGLISTLLEELGRFTGAGWDQEDDVTLVTLNRQARGGSGSEPQSEELATFTISSERGNERLAMERVAELVEPLGLDQRSLERLKTAVAETTMNAIEHGNDYRAELPVDISVAHSADSVTVRITDQGGDKDFATPAIPDLEAKLAGEQTPRGWGLFLIRNMVDEMRVMSDERHHTVELVVSLKGEGDAAR